MVDHGANDTEDIDDTDEAGGTDITVRHGREGDLLAVLRVLEGAMLDVGANQIRERTDVGEVLVAVVDGRVVGALVRDGDHVEAIAVHPDRRDAGVGGALIERALAETSHLTAEFRDEVRPFYEKLGFEIEDDDGGGGGDEDVEGETDDGRLWGERVGRGS
jgi:GNAT superfamily N-acetyltransferase